jgi:hypothetical protein
MAELPCLAHESRRSPCANASLNWSMFMDRIADLTWMASTRETEERYVDTVGTLLSQLNFCDPHIRRSRLGPKLRQGFPTFSDLEQRMTIEVKLLSFEPGDGIEAHDHPDMTGVMACVSGRVSVDNYERVLNEESSGCLFYRWQKEFFENGAAAFEQKARPNHSAEQERIAYLEKKIQTKDEVLAELMAEHVTLKKDIGEL